LSRALQGWLSAVNNAVNNTGEGVKLMSHLFLFPVLVLFVLFLSILITRLILVAKYNEEIMNIQ